MHCNKHTISIKLNATFLVPEKVVKHLEVGLFGLTWLSCATVVHLIVGLLWLVLRRFAPYVAYVIQRFASYATHAIRRFSPDVFALIGQVGPSKFDANFPIQSSDGSFRWTTVESMYNMKGWTHFFLMGLVQNQPHVHVHNVLPPSLEQMHRFLTIGFLREALLVVSPLCLKF